MEQYYYNHMDKQKQAVYHKILQGIMGLDDEFQVPLLEGEDLEEVIKQKKFDMTISTLMISIFLWIMSH